jgi:hypothetical protein
MSSSFGRSFPRCLCTVWIVSERIRDLDLASPQVARLAHAIKRIRRSAQCAEAEISGAQHIAHLSEEVSLPWPAQGEAAGDERAVGFEMENISLRSASLVTRQLILFSLAITAGAAVLRR